ncbi:MAG: FAD-dependent oxidoreductase [Oscillospiraceae bacterium]|jgi:2,4-dienoyl-CoA reductase-like NADH-dependent reductase (Old Yellow Enzyme family)|nr:FAD-dependent oxidoreductase [Oscillospiraceae bacterium]
MKQHILQPISLGPVTSKNRIEVAPAAPFLAGHDTSVTPEFYEYTMELARSGAGIVTIGVTNVEPGGSRTLSAGSPMYMSDLNDLAEGIKRHGALASIELVSSRYMMSPPDKTVASTSTEDVEAIIRSFADAAALCRAAGFDMVMIHGGHGNVPAMFYNKKFNRRTDRFGDRFRFGTELLSAIRDRAGGGLAVEYRISAEEMLPDMTTFEETLEYAKVIEPYIDILHVSRGLLEEDSLLPYINAPCYLPRALNLPFAREFKRALNIPVSVVGSFDLDIAERAIESGDVDMVAMIRTVLADTRCVEKARRGMDDDIRPCIRCNTCISRTHSQFLTVRCAVNARVGLETRLDARRAPQPRKVVIVGGGPAGLEAARACALKGHDAVLFEQSETLGGLLRPASRGPLKADLRAYLDWSVRSVADDKNITLRLGESADRDAVAAECPDAVVVAVGAKPILPAFTLSGTKSVVWAGDVEAGAETGDDVLIAGAGFTGLELALTLARRGKRVRVADMLPESEIGRGGSPINLICLRELLDAQGVEIICGARLEDMTLRGADIVYPDGTSSVLGCDTLVLSLGFRVDEAAAHAYDGMCAFVRAVGDAAGGGTVRNAVRTAFDSVMCVE